MTLTTNFCGGNKMPERIEITKMKENYNNREYVSHY